MVGIGRKIESAVATVDEWTAELSTYFAAHPQVKLGAMVVVAVVVTVAVFNLVMTARAAIAARRRGDSYRAIFRAMFGIPAVHRPFGIAVPVRFRGLAKRRQE